MKLIEEIEEALIEARQIRSRHDGIHSVHSCLAVLEICRGFAEEGHWNVSTQNAFDTTVSRLRHIDRTGYDIAYTPRSCAPSCCFG